MADSALLFFLLPFLPYLLPPKIPLGFYENIIQFVIPFWIVEPTVL